MKRIFAVVTVMLALALAAFSQTSVTLQVTDADSIPWAFGTYSVYATSALAAQPVGAASLVSSTLSGSGGASLSLSANTYTFRACPAVFSRSGGTYGSAVAATGCYSTSVAVAGGSQTVTLAPPAIRIPLLNGVSVGAYADAEVTGAYANARYYNVITGTERIYNGTSWAEIGGAFAFTSQKAETGTADTNVLTFTPPSVAGTYRVCFVASVASATTGVISYTASYKDSNGNAQSNIAQFLVQAGTAAPNTTFTTSAAGNYHGCSSIDVDASGTAIVLKWVGGGTTSAKVSALIEKQI